jgi:hypothetical protein
MGPFCQCQSDVGNLHRILVKILMCLTYEISRTCQNVILLCIICCYLIALPLFKEIPSDKHNHKHSCVCVTFVSTYHLLLEFAQFLQSKLYLLREVQSISTSRILNHIRRTLTFAVVPSSRSSNCRDNLRRTTTSSLRTPKNRPLVFESRPTLHSFTNNTFFVLRSS